MKKLISILLSLSIAATALAQPQGAHKHGPRKPDFEKIKAEKVAFITNEVGLTSQEAEKFWPVYNKIENEQQELAKAERTACMDLNKALASGEGDVSALLDAYLAAKNKNVNLHAANAKEYKKVLSVEKVAKFFTCEEKFRRQQIGRVMGGGHGPQGGPEFSGEKRGNKGGKGFPGEGFGPRGEKVEKAK